MEEEIRIINNIIVESIMRSDDKRGSYHFFKGKALLFAIYKWIEFKGLPEEFCVEERHFRNDHSSHYYIPQIVKKV